MNDELDPGLRRLFAETAEHPADESFVAAVTVTTSRERRVRMLARALLVSVIVAALATAMGLGLNHGLGAVATLAATSPVGWPATLALALAAVICVRSVGPLLARLQR